MKKLYEFIENEYGRKLTKEEKRQAKNDFKKSAEFDKANLSDANVRLAKRHSYFNNPVLKYSATALVAVVACLSIVLPIKFDNNKGGNLPNLDTTPPPTITETKYQSSDVKQLPTDIEWLEMYGFLLFNSQEVEVSPGILEIKSEYAKSNPSLDLSHTLTTITTEGTRFIQRMRTYENYLFEDYKNFLTDDNELLEFTLLATIGNTDILFSDNEFDKVVYLYFTYNSVEYFFEISTALSGIDYIENTFLPTLFN